MSFCTNCGKPSDVEAKFCGQCGIPLNQNPDINQEIAPAPDIENTALDGKSADKITAGSVAAVLLLVVAITGGAYLAQNTPNPTEVVQRQAERNIQSIKNRVAEDAVHQYYMVKNDHGGKIERCVQAGIAAAAYLQAQDEHDYEQWHQTERMDCAIAGVPIQ